MHVTVPHAASRHKWWGDWLIDLFKIKQIKNLLDLYSSSQVSVMNKKESILNQPTPAQVVTTKPSLSVYLFTLKLDVYKLKKVFNVDQRPYRLMKSISTFGSIVLVPPIVGLTWKIILVLIVIIIIAVIIYLIKQWKRRKWDLNEIIPSIVIIIFIPAGIYMIRPWLMLI
jgi:hypothetical protein